MIWIHNTLIYKSQFKSLTNVLTVTHYIYSLIFAISVHADQWALQTETKRLIIVLMLFYYYYYHLPTITWMTLSNTCRTPMPIAHIYVI